MTIIGAILAFVFLEGLARYALIAALVVVDLFEITIWLRWRQKKATTGAEAFIGARAVVVTACRPDGQVRMRGQLWKATSRVGAGPGDEVVVNAVDGILLEVVPINFSEPAPSSADQGP